jgi:hypothetical protein
VVDSADLYALQHSPFVKDSFAAMITKTTVADSGMSWTGTYLYGTDNYFEIFDNQGLHDSTGNSGFALGTDKEGDIHILESSLQKKYKTDFGLREKQFGDTLIPWFDMMGVDDSMFFLKTHIVSWIMEYKTAYFDYKKLPHGMNTVSRKDYLSENKDSVKTKILKRFTALTLRVTDAEKQFYSELLLNCGFHKLKDEYVSADGFIFRFITRTTGGQSSVAAASFETNSFYKGTVKISKNISIECNGNTGRITFR